MFFIQGIPCFNSNKKRGEMGHWGFEHGSPKHEPSGLVLAACIYNYYTINIVQILNNFIKPAKNDLNY